MVGSETCCRPEPLSSLSIGGRPRLRAYLIGAGGQVLERAVAPESGIQSVAAGGFPAALDAACSNWFAEADGLPVLMAGMVGSRNGWAEAAYAAPPCRRGRTWRPLCCPFRRLTDRSSLFPVWIAAARTAAMT